MSAHTNGRVILLASLVGILAGCLAVCFHILVVLVTDHVLLKIGGYFPGGPYNETFKGKHESLAAVMYRYMPWMLILLPAIGGLVNGFLIQRYELMAAGHGTGAAIRAFHHGTRLRRRLPFAKMLTSAITLGTGGSGGREGPIAEMGAAIGYWIGDIFKLTAVNRRRLLLAGMGAGIGAIFHAPLAGAIFAIEVMYRDPEFEADALIPAFVSSVCAYSVFSFAFSLGSFQPLFEVGFDLGVDRPLLWLPQLTVTAVVMAAASWLFSKIYTGTEHVFSNLKISPMVKPAIGGGLVGVVAVIAYLSMSWAGQQNQTDAMALMSTGYGFLQRLLLGETFVVNENFGPLITVMLIVGFGKMLTTALTSGSGGSGGVFGPSMVIGGCLAGVLGILFHLQNPSVVDEEAIVIFVLLGMAAFFSASASTPVSTLIMVSELTNGYALLLPSMWVCALAYILSTRWSIYGDQVASRRESPAHRSDFIIDVLQGLTVDSAITQQHKTFKTVDISTPLDDLSRMVTHSLHASFTVVDTEGKYYGLFSLNDIRKFLYESGLGPLAIAQDVATEGVEPLLLNMSLSGAINRFAESRFDELPVVDEADPDTVVAMLRRQDLLSVYNRTLMQLRSADTKSAAAESKP